MNAKLPGELCASLPLEQRPKCYRHSASEAMRAAGEAQTSEQKVELLTMAAGWHDLATLAERELETKR